MVVVVVAFLVLVAGCDATAPAQPSDGFNPLAAREFYVDPYTSAQVAADAANPPRSELTAIAATPQARWIGNEVPIADVAGSVRAFVTAADSVSKMPFLTLYAIPHRDCGGFAAGGFATGDEYRAWVDQVSAGIGNAPVGIIIEPDALTAADCLPAEEQQERQALLRDAVQMLSRNRNAAVYVDAGHSRWLTPEELARRLSDVDVGLVRGFSLNTSNFFTTAEEIAYGEAVSNLTNGAHYVIDTSRNGAGPAPDAPLNWCNPPGRALGAFPTTNTAGAHADAYLWIKNPGQSDGDCGRGEPFSGVFFTSYAIDLVQNPRG